MKVYDIDFDFVLDGVVANGSIRYGDALEKLVPLINKTEFQRKLQDRKFYEKLERDLERGCIMPPITIAYVHKEKWIRPTPQDIEFFFNSNHSTAFILDGIQRLNTLERVSKSGKLDLNKKLYLTIVFSSNDDKLLYRMITLNNGQKPMTPRHQVEVMMANVFDFEKLGIEFQTEKERAEKTIIHSFNKADLVQAYLAYMANSPMVDNKKIIEEKMDELIVSKIISNEPISATSSFRNVVIALSKFQKSLISLKWLRQANNLVGFAVGMKHSSRIIEQLSVKEFEESIVIFENAFSDFNPSKIKMGKLRRELSCEFFRNYSKLRHFDRISLLEHFNELTND